jgi:hemoglobin-like flavoprotein
MTPKQIRLVQESFQHVLPIKEQAASLFYERLFERNPRLKPLFKGDMGEQGKKLMKVLATVVGALNRLDDIVPAVQALGRKHAQYGVTDDHYPLVGATLLWTLRQGLGGRFTAEVEEAWAAAYTLLARVMQEAAAGTCAQPGEPARALAS